MKNKRSSIDAIQAAQDMRDMLKQAGIRNPTMEETFLHREASARRLTKFNKQKNLSLEE